MKHATLIHAYLMMNALIFFAWLLLEIGYRSTRGIGIRVGHRHWIAIAQVLLGCSIAAPVVLATIPDRKLPGSEWAFFQPAPEGGPALSLGAIKTALPKHTLPARASVAGSRESYGGALMAKPAWSVAFFLLVLSACLFRLLRARARLRAVLREAIPIRALGAVRIVVSDSVRVPFSSFLAGEAWVALPSSIVERSTDLGLAVKHELQHHRQGDTRWALVVEYLLCFFFANPALRLIKSRISELQEFACDEALVGRRGVSVREYGDCLLRAAESALGFREAPAGTTCMAVGALKKRVELFTRPTQVRSKPTWAICLGTALVLCTLAVAYGAETGLRGKGSLPEPNPGQAGTDPEMQRIAEAALSEAVTSQKAKGGFAIVADPQSGRVLAIANVSTESKKTGQWALSQELEPASLANTLVIAEALERGLTTPDETHGCESGNYKYGGRVYHDWKDGGWDRLSTRQIIAVSSDICSMKIGEKIGVEGLQKMLVRFGIGPSGSTRSFPGALEGVLPPLQNESWPTVIPAVSSGFGFRITPLELLQIYGAIANGGNLMAPATADDLSEGKILRRVLSQETAASMRKILTSVVTTGTAKGNATSTLYTMAGKTATSYVADLTQWELVHRPKKGNLASFIGFAPVDHPRIEVYVAIHEPHTDEGGAHGARHAAPVFKRIAEAALKSLKVAPDQP